MELLYSRLLSCSYCHGLSFEAEPLLINISHCNCDLQKKRTFNALITIYLNMTASFIFMHLCMSTWVCVSDRESARVGGRESARESARERERERYSRHLPVRIGDVYKTNYLNQKQSHVALVPLPVMFTHWLSRFLLCAQEKQTEPERERGERDTSAVQQFPWVHVQARKNRFTNLSVQPDLGKIMDSLSLSCGYYLMTQTTASVKDINIDQFILNHP